jgi:ABC-2 type transport system permease protein
MMRLVSAEVLKLRTTRTFYVLMLIALALVVLPTIPISAFADFSDADQDGPIEVFLFFIGGLIQSFALVLGILAATTEFRHGTITPTLLVVPNRVRLMVAKLIAGLAVGLVLGLVSTGLIELIVMAFASARDFDAGPDKLAMFIGGTLTTALYAGFGVGLGMLVRNQVGALVGALIYVYVAEPLIGGLAGLWHVTDDIMPRFSLGAVGNGLSGIDISDERVLGQLPAGLLLLLYVAIVVGAGLVMMQRRDITA